jgi:hypothetical protein
MVGLAAHTGKSIPMYSVGLGKRPFATMDARPDNRTSDICAVKSQFDYGVPYSTQGLGKDPMV